MTVPLSVALAGKVMVWSNPAFTTGGWFTGTGLTVTTTSSVADKALSFAVSRKT